MTTPFEVEAAVQLLKKGKAAGVDNIPAELVQAGGEDVITALTTICNRRMANPVDPVLSNHTSQERQPATVLELPNNQPHQSCKVMQKITLNRLKQQAEKITAEEQAGFRAGKSTTEQIFNLRILCEKYLQHQQDLYHVFIDFKKAFDRVWHAALWATMKKYNISTNLIKVIKNLYNKATSAVLLNGNIGDWFLITVGVRQGYLLSATLFNSFVRPP